MESIEKTVQNRSEGVEKLMRLGFAAKGVIYVTIGLLALQAAFGLGGQTTGSRGALVEIASQPLGQVLLGIVAVGLLGLTLWYIARGVPDIEGKGDDPRGLAKRAGAIGSGVGYALLAVFAFQILLGSSGGGDGPSKSDWTATLMEVPWGRWLVGLVGLVVIGTGLFQFYRAYQAKFREKINSSEMSGAESEWGTRAGQFGIVARGVVVIIIGVFLVNAAWQYDPQEAGGLGQALETLAQQPYGAWVLGVVAAGLIAYGLFAGLILARYRQIPIG